MTKEEYEALPEWIRNVYDHHSETITGPVDYDEKQEEERDYRDAVMFREHAGDLVRRIVELQTEAKIKDARVKSIFILAEHEIGDALESLKNLREEYLDVSS